VKVTKRQLKQIIREEIQKALNEQQLRTGPGSEGNVCDCIQSLMTTLKGRVANPDNWRGTPDGRKCSRSWDIYAQKNPGASVPAVWKTCQAAAPEMAGAPGGTEAGGLSPATLAAKKKWEALCARRGRGVSDMPPFKCV